MYNTVDNGKRLRELRGDQSATVVSAACGISTSALSLYESGERNPRDEVKIALSQYYHIPVEDIFYPD